MFGWVKKIKDKFTRSSKKVKDVIVPPPPVLSAGEQALIGWKVDYVKQKDGTLVVPGNLNVSNLGLTQLPDLSDVVVQGNFSCLKNNLTSLKGAPRMFGALMSDFGVFWEGHIPDDLRNPPQKPKPAANPGSFDL
jgi:hypothetical protein